MLPITPQMAAGQIPLSPTPFGAPPPVTQHNLPVMDLLQNLSGQLRTSQTPQAPIVDLSGVPSAANQLGATGNLLSQFLARSPGGSPGANGQVPGQPFGVPLAAPAPSAVPGYGQWTNVPASPPPPSPGTSTPSSPPSSPDWLGYLNAYPDLQAAYAQNKKSPIYTETPEAFAQRHYRENGQAEGRTVPGLSAGAPLSPAPAQTPSMAQIPAAALPYLAGMSRY